METTKELPTAAEVAAAVETQWKSWGMPSSDPLRRSWEAEAGAFLEGIAGFSDPELRKRIRPVCAPLGAGKSLTLELFAAMLSRMHGASHPGGLIVVKLQEDADKMAGEINKRARGMGYRSPQAGGGSREYAAAFHSDTKKYRREHEPPLPPIEMEGPRKDIPILRHFPILILCHRALELSFEALGRKGSMTEMQRAFHSYLDGGRAFRCVDEALNLQLDVHLSGHDLAMVQAALMFWKGASKYPVELAAIRDTLSQHHGPGGTVYPNPIRKPGEPRPSFKDLRDDLLDNGGLRGKEIRGQAERTLTKLYRIHEEWSWLNDNPEDNGGPILTTACALIPDDALGFTLLDGTSKENPVLEMLSNVDPVIRIEGCKTFRNLTLNIAEVDSVSRTHTMTVIERRVPAFIRELQEKTKGRKVLLVARKEVADYIRATKKVDKDGTVTEPGWMPEGWELIHYGNKTEGSNEYRDFTDIGILNFPYRTQQDAPTTIMTHTRRKRSTEFLLSPEGRDEIRIHQHRQLICEISQACGRICVRKTINTEGDCPPCNIWLLMPNDDDNPRTQGSGAAVVYGLLDHFEGLTVAPMWDIDVDRKGRAPRESIPRKVDKLVEFLLGMPGGARVYVDSPEMVELGVSAWTFRCLATRIWKGDQKDPIPCLKTAGITTGKERNNRNGRVYICKHLGFMTLLRIYRNGRYEIAVPAFVL